MPCGGVRASRCGGFPCCGAQGLGNAGSVVTAHGLSSPVARGIFPDQGLNHTPALAGRFLATAPPGKS